MSFGAPLGLLALLAGLPIVLAYFLRRKQPDLQVSALFLWRTPSSVAESGGRLDRFSREASLLLELLAVLMAALFLSDFRCQQPKGRQLVAVLDGSLSMSARVDATAVAERAVKALLERARVENAHVLTVVESGLRPRVLVGPQAPIERAHETLERWRPQGPSHSPIAALLLATELAGRNTRVRFFTDGPVLNAADLPTAIEVVALGEPLPNTAFTAVSRTTEGTHDALVLRLGRYGDAPSRARVFIRDEGGALLHDVELNLADGSGRIRLEVPSGKVLSAHLPDDALPEDGELRLAVAAERKVTVTVQAALPEVARAALEHFLEVSPDVARGENGSLVFGPPGSGSSVELGAKGELKRFIGPFFVEGSHAMLEDVDLRGVVWAAGDPPPGRALVSAGPLALISEESSGTVHLNIDLGRSNLHRAAAWPILLSNLVRRSRAQAPGFAKSQALLGEDVSAYLPGAGPYQLIGPNGATALFGRGQVLLPPFTTPGTYSVSDRGSKMAELHVLALDASESDLSTRGSFKQAARMSHGVSMAAVGERPVWPLWCFLVLLLADFAVTARRRASR